MTKLTLGNQQVKIDGGELVGYQVDGHEYIHQKGSPGWRNADTEMFPIIGPIGEADFRIKTPKGMAIQDQHGLLRELEYHLGSASGTTAVFIKEYKAGTVVRNSKFPEKSTETSLWWPYDFSFRKKMELTAKGLEITFQVSAEMGMPFMLGYHPAFKLYSEKPIILANHTKITLDEVLSVGSRALPILNCTELTLMDKRQMTLKTEGFGNFMLWTEVPNMICLEPVTFYPYAVAQKSLHEGFRHVADTETLCKVTLLPHG